MRARFPSPPIDVMDAATEAAPLHPKPPPPRGPASWHRPQQPLRVPSGALFWALLAGPMLAWWACVAAGVAAYSGLPKDGRRVYHIMGWFDRGLLRPAGPVLPFAVLFIRVVVNAAADRLEAPAAAAGSAAAAAAAAAAGGGGARRRFPALPTLAWTCFCVYSVIAVARVALYLMHYYAMRASLLSEHLVSDHLFLGGTILICLHAEVICLASDVIRTVEARRVTAREVGLTAAAVAAMLLIVFTAADMYFTVKFFHYRVESIATAAAVFIMFQAPVLAWLIRSRRHVSGSSNSSGSGSSSSSSVAAPSGVGGASRVAAAPAFALS